MAHDAVTQSRKDSMFAKFHCHAMFAGDNKITWNIEPWRTENNLVKVIATKCNP